MDTLKEIYEGFKRGFEEGGTRFSWKSFAAATLLLIFAASGIAHLFSYLFS